MTYTPAPDRYEDMSYNRCGNSGLRIPPLALGLWQNFGEDRSLGDIRSMVRRAFDLGITHFDLANNYGPPPGSAEENFGRLLRTDLAAHRDELIVTTKAGYEMWPGPYGGMGGSRKYLTASLDQSLKRMGLEYVDIFYSHRFDADTPLEETMGALASAVKQGKALYVGISSYSATKTAEAAKILRDLGTPCLIHQPSYSMLNRWIEESLLDTLDREGIGCIAFSPLAQGLLTDKYLNGIPENARVNRSPTFPEDFLNDDNLEKVRALDEIARERGQTLAQMAIAWVLRDPRVTATVIGASRVSQIEDCVQALETPSFSDEEIDRIDQYATDAGINLWRASSEAG
ncbi:MAG TPA: L-glyceraldehyde 3-phosphate reductase [Gammaproteobacteria bacterium]|nr:L-glyceraldehyde 3-phosphate reductase [Gammaproteobacteria bacterium]